MAPPAPPSQGGCFRALLLSLAWAHRGSKAAARHFPESGFGGAGRDWDWNPCHSSLLCESHRKRLPARLDGRGSQHGVALLPSSGCLAGLEWPPQAQQCEQARWAPLLNARPMLTWFLPRCYLPLLLGGQ